MITVAHVVTAVEMITVGVFIAELTPVRLRHVETVLIMMRIIEVG